MKADLVDGAGNVVSPLDVMLHHVVFAKVRARDYTCPGSIAERFYAEGEERMVMALPPGYGYANAAGDLWGLVYMLMNHHNRAETVVRPLHGHLRHRPGAHPGAADLARRPQLPGRPDLHRARDRRQGLDATPARSTSGCP